MNVSSGFIHNHQKLETNQMSLNGVIDKHNVIHSCNGILLSDKRNELLIHVTTGLNLKYIILSERSQTQKSTYYMISFYDSLAKTKLQIR